MAYKESVTRGNLNAEVRVWGLMSQGGKHSTSLCVGSDHDPRPFSRPDGGEAREDG